MSIPSQLMSNLSIDSTTALVDAPCSRIDLEMFFSVLLDQLPKSSQVNNAEAIQVVIKQLRENGVCRLEGSDQEIRSGCVGFQCLVEEAFLEVDKAFTKADFEIHTTMPSTPCCQLPNEKAKETFLAVFGDEARLATVDGRSVSLDAITNLPNATLHLTYTEAGYNRRSDLQKKVLKEYWEAKERVHTTCIASHEVFPAEVHGATYRLQMISGTEMFFGIQASQALVADSQAMIVHFGTRNQPEVKAWLDGVESGLAERGRTLFAG